MENYKIRIADEILADKLDAMGCVLIEGPKYCGKTTLALQHANSTLFMADPDTKTQNLILAQTNINRLLEGATRECVSTDFSNTIRDSDIFKGLAFHESLRSYHIFTIRNSVNTIRNSVNIIRNSDAF